MAARHHLALWVCAAAAGCAHAPPHAAAEVIRVYGEALARDDPRPVYRMLSDELRAQVPEAEFAARWRAEAVERKAAADALLGHATVAGEVAQVRLPGGRVALLTREIDGWRLLSPRLEEPGATTPAEAVRRLATALEEHNLDGMLRLLGDPVRGLVERELNARWNGLRPLDVSHLQVHGDSLRIPYGTGYYIELKRENGQWRVVDFN